MRITIPKSQGKQAFYDARKASWGDMFPHAPKNAPQERFQTSGGKEISVNAKGSHIGKRGDKHKPLRNSYNALVDDLKEKKRKDWKQRVRLESDDGS